MLRVLLSLKQTFCQRILIVALMLFISMSSLFCLQQPSFAVTSLAANPLTPDAKIDRAYQYGEAAGIREEQREDAYEQAVKDSENPQSLEKAYERNEKAYEKENPQPNIIEKTEKLIENVTSK